MAHPLLDRARGLVGIVATGVLAYEILLGIVGLLPPPTARRGPLTARRLRILIPAHDEEGVIGGLLDDLSRQDTDGGFFDVVVIADHCSDRTAEIAKAYARVIERHAGTGTKGSALRFALETEPPEPGEVIAVIDADNRVPPTFVEQMMAALAEGHVAVQARIDSPTVERGVGAGISAAYAVGNRAQVARSILGLSADLGGTGMAIDGEVLAQVGGFSEVFSEDKDLACRLVLAGFRVHAAQGAVVVDEKPDRLRDAARQRARWAVGNRLAARTHLRALVGRAVVCRSPVAADMAYRLVRPGRATMMALAAGSIAGARPSQRGRLSALSAAFVTLPVAALLKEGAGLRAALDLIRAGVAPLAHLLGQLRWRHQHGWFHTPHGHDR